jgi:hypothetical protein
MKTSLTRAAFTLAVLLLIVIGAFSAPKTKIGKVKQPAEAVQGCSTIDDATLSTNVAAKISQHPSLTGQQVNATAQNRIVTLTGTVSSRSKKQIAGRTAASTRCVKRVVNQLVVSQTIRADFLCCCDGFCWQQSTKCPACFAVKQCVDDYKAALAAAGQDRDARTKAREDFLACTCNKRE